MCDATWVTRPVRVVSAWGVAYHACGTTAGACEGPQAAIRDDTLATARTREAARDLHRGVGDAAELLGTFVELVNSLGL